MDGALEHETRRMIFNHIMAHPGVSFNILKKVFNLNDSTLRYHLSYLERNEKISFGIEEGKRNYYPHFGEEIIIRDTEEFPQSNNLTSVQEELISIIKHRPGIKQKELVRKSDYSRISVINNVNKLMDLCIVRKLPSENGVHYEYIETEQLRFEILRSLVIKLLKHEIDE